MNRGGVSCDDKNPCHVCRENFEKDDTGSHKKRIIQLRKDRKAKREKRKSSVTPLKRTPWEESDDDFAKGTWVLRHSLRTHEINLNLLTFFFIDLSLSAEWKAKLEKFQRELAEEEEREKQERASLSIEDIKATLKEQLAPLKQQLKDVVKDVNKLKSKEIAKSLTPSGSKKANTSKPTKDSVKRTLLM